MTITVGSIDELVEVIAGLVRKGLTFHAEGLTITLLGGY